MLRAMVGAQAAEDCFQETFLAALRAYPRLRADSAPRAWLLTIAHNKAIDHLRRSRREHDRVARRRRRGSAGRRRGGLARGRRARAPPARRGCAALHRRSLPPRDRRRDRLFGGGVAPFPARRPRNSQEEAMSDPLARALRAPRPRGSRRRGALRRPRRRRAQRRPRLRDDRQPARRAAARRRSRAAWSMMHYLDEPLEPALEQIARTPLAADRRVGARRLTRGGASSMSTSRAADATSRRRSTGAR